MDPKNKKEISFVPAMRMIYRDEIVPSMLKTFNYSNVMQVPKIK